MILTVFSGVFFGNFSKRFFVSQLFNLFFFNYCNFNFLLKTTYSKLLDSYVIIGSYSIHEEDFVWIDNVFDKWKFIEIKNEDSIYSFTSFYVTKQFSEYFDDFLEEDLLNLKNDISFLKTKNVFKNLVLDQVAPDDLDVKSDESDSDDEVSDVFYDTENTVVKDFITKSNEDTTTSSDETDEDTVYVEGVDKLLHINNLEEFPPVYLNSFSSEKMLTINDLNNNLILDDVESDDETVQIKPINTTSRFKLIFNENRKLLLEFFSFKKLRQKRFNRTFVNFTKNNSYRLLLMMELNIVSLLLRTNLVFSKNLLKKFIDKKIIFLNGFSINHLNYTLNVGDRIQFILDKNFFFLYRYLLSYNLELEQKSSTVVWKLIRFNFNFYKQKSTKIPNWIVDLMYFNSETPKFIEIDYSILTFIIIFKPFFYFDFDVYHILNINYFLSRLYLWKYIV